MSPIPTEMNIDWTQIAAWGTGIGTVAGSMGAAIWLAIRKVVSVAEAAPSPPPQKQTTIITGDTVAMHDLQVSLEAVNVSLTELLVLIRKELHDRQVDEEVARKLESEVDKEVRRQLETRAAARARKISE